MALIQNSKTFTNNNEIYSSIFNSKKIKNIKQLEIFNFENIENLDLDYNLYVVKSGDTLQKISFEVYGNPRYWAILAITNKINDIFSIKAGDAIKIYFPIQNLINKMVL